MADSSMKTVQDAAKNGGVEDKKVRTYTRRNIGVIVLVALALVILYALLSLSASDFRGTRSGGQLVSTSPTTSCTPGKTPNQQLTTVGQTVRITRNTGCGLYLYKPISATLEVRYAGSSNWVRWSGNDPEPAATGWPAYADVKLISGRGAYVRGEFR